MTLPTTSKPDPAPAGSARALLDLEFAADALAAFLQMGVCPHGYEREDLREFIPRLRALATRLAAVEQARDEARAQMQILVDRLNEAHERLVVVEQERDEAREQIQRYSDRLNGIYGDFVEGLLRGQEHHDEVLAKVEADRTHLRSALAALEQEMRDLDISVVDAPRVERQIYEWADHLAALRGGQEPPSFMQVARLEGAIAQIHQELDGGAPTLEELKARLAVLRGAGEQP